MRARRELLPLLLVLVGLALGELMARALAPRLTWRPLPPFGRSEIQEEWVERMDRITAGEEQSHGYSTFDADLGWTTRRGWTSPDGTIHTNALGLRGRRELDARRPDPERVLVCGESFTFGEEVADEEAWPAVLEGLLGTEVWNYGVGGYGTDQALLRLRAEARGKAAALVVGLMLENIGRNVNRYRPIWYPSATPAAKPRFLLGEGGALELLPQPFRTRAELVEAVRSEEVFGLLGEHEYWSASTLPAWLGWSKALRLVESKRLYAARDLEPLWRRTDGEPFRVTAALVEAFEAEAQRLDAELLVLVFPDLPALREYVATGSRYWTPILEHLALRGIQVLDCTEPLADAARADGKAAPLFGTSHYSPRGNAVIARAVAERLQQP